MQRVRPRGRAQPRIGLGMGLGFGLGLGLGLYHRHRNAEQVYLEAVPPGALPAPAAPAQNRSGSRRVRSAEAWLKANAAHGADPIPLVLVLNSS